MPHELPDLPYPLDALEPHMSRETLALHHGKHHAAYVRKLNGLIEGTDWADVPLNDIVERASGTLFDNGAQAWNHAFFWRCLSPRGGGDPGGELGAAITRDFGSADAFREQFSEALSTIFGSGWVWLVRDVDGRLHVQAASNAGNPLSDGHHPLLTCDIWEHAYYVDHRNEKKRYVDAFWKLVNWEFAAENLGGDMAFAP